MKHVRKHLPMGTVEISAFSLKFYPCFFGFDFFKSAYTLVGYVTFKKIKPTLQGSNFNGKAEISTVPMQAKLFMATWFILSKNTPMDLPL